MPSTRSMAITRPALPGGKCSGMALAATAVPPTSGEKGSRRDACADTAFAGAAGAAFVVAVAAAGFAGTFAAALASCLTGVLVAGTCAGGTAGFCTTATVFGAGFVTGAWVATAFVVGAGDEAWFPLFGASLGACATGFGWFCGAAAGAGDDCPACPNFERTALGNWGSCCAATGTSAPVAPSRAAPIIQIANDLLNLRPVIRALVSRYRIVNPAS